jgi:hypothetical protein
MFIKMLEDWAAMARPCRRPRRAARSLAADSGGVGSSVIAFLVAGVLFMASVVAVLVATNGTGGDGASDASDTAAMRIQARDLASTVLGSPGFGAGGLDWAAGANPYTGATASAEGIVRLGLLDDQSAEPSMMEFAKFQNLRRAKYAADPADGYVDYREAVSSLGLDAADLDFHLRAYPALDSVIQLLAEGRKDENLRVAYIGDVGVTDPLPPSVPPTQGLTYSLGRPIVCTKDASAYPNAYRLSLTLTNGGQTTTQFSAFVTSKLGTGALQTQNTNGYTVAPGQSTTLFVDVAATEGRVCSAGSTVTFDVYDNVHGRLLSIPYTLPANETVSGASPNGRGLYVDTNLVNYRPTDHVVLNWAGGGLDNNDRLILRVCKGTAECTSDAGDANRVYQEDGGATFRSGNKNQRSVDVGALPAGNYTAWLYDCETTSCAVPLPAGSSHLRATEKIAVTASAVAGYTPPSATAGPPVYSAANHAAIEVSMLDQLVKRFCPTYFFAKDQAPVLGYTTEADWTARCAAFKGAQAQPGDVFPDTKKFMNEDLPKRLLDSAGAPRYDLSNVLVVGSKVDQNAMTSASAKQTIRDWVLGGGTLIVFGTTEGNVNWLEPLFHSAIRGGGGAISVPDISHPILHTPDELDDPAHNYDPRGESWNFNGQTAQVQKNETTALFTNVIVDGDPLTGNPLLADSNPGAIGNGSIILTSYLPYDIYGSSPAGAGKGQPSTGPHACPGRTAGDCESLKFIHNLLMSGYSDLYLDYGPQCPLNTNCIPEVRTAQIRHPLFTDPIQLRLNVFVFPHES